MVLFPPVRRKQLHPCRWVASTLLAGVSLVGCGCASQQVATFEPRGFSSTYERYLLQVGQNPARSVDATGFVEKGSAPSPAAEPVRPPVVAEEPVTQPRLSWFRRDSQ